MIQRFPNSPWFAFRPGAFGARAVRFLPVLFLVITAACSSVAQAPAPEPPSPPPIPSLEQGSLPPSVMAQGERQLEEARSALGEERFQDAIDAATTVVEHYPGLPGSGEAVEILARAYLALDQPSRGLEAASRFRALLDPSHPAFGRAVLLEAEALAQDGNPDQAVQRLLSLPVDQADGIVQEASDVLGSLLEGRPPDQILGLIRSLDGSHPLRGVLESEMAVALALLGREAEAEEWARAALQNSLGLRAEARARAVLEGTLEEMLGRPQPLGAIFPESGASPGLLEYGQWVREGLQVALQTFADSLPQPVTVVVMDDEGEPSGAGVAMASLSDSGVVGVVGPLTADALAAAAEERRGLVPIISPFASTTPGGAEAVYSLSGPDPGGARAVAAYAWELGLERVAVVRPATEAAKVDAEAFLEEFRQLGGTGLPEVVYDSGATFFQPQFDQVASQLPDGLFLPLSPADIQLLAPQFTYYGLDTLGIQVLGTSGWTADEIVQEVDPRHTDGVIASTTRVSQEETEAFQAFRAAYETLFQKTLRSQVPAFGFDAAGLLLTALRARPKDPQAFLQALEEIRDFPGATGRLSIEDGRILREPHLVRIQNRELIYISSRFE